MKVAAGITGFGYDDGARAAAVVVPLLVGRLAPRTVLDVGCGIGHWLAAFRESGVTDLQGVDGPWVAADLLRIAPDQFQVVDLNVPLKLPRKSDLAICLEVGEHVRPDAADTLVASLAEAADVVCFSAAIPRQGGRDHINEQYQGYWRERFARHGLRAYDWLRPRVAGAEGVAFWYQQNTLLYMTPETAERHGLKEEPFVADWVHPTLYEYYQADLATIPLRDLAQQLILRLKRWVGGMLRRR